MLTGADVLLLFVDRELIVRLFEGSHKMAQAIKIPGNEIVGSLLAEAWPDKDLLNGVTEMMNEQIVRAVRAIRALAYAPG